MPFMTFEEQIDSHENYLRQHGLDVDKLIIGSKEFIRCHAIGDKEGTRGEFCYKTHKNPMNKPGLIGLLTKCRIPGGDKLTYKTYGQDGDVANDSISLRPFLTPLPTINSKPNDDIGAKCRYIWGTASGVGASDYLIRKGVGAYGIRFKVNDYGRVALVPACDASGILQAVQFLNPNGQKRFVTGSKPTGLFHMLRKPKEGERIGIAESYVTSATCMELTDIPIVCAFSSDNLMSVALTIRKLYPNNPLIIFADNDRHLEKNDQNIEKRKKQNIGLSKAVEACAAVGNNISIAVPDFDNLAASKDASDWNDLVRLRGRDVAKARVNAIVK